MFTGGIDNGRRVLTTLAARGVPALAELSGFDPAIVLPDAPRASTVRSLTWGAFVGCGQACVAVKRVYVVGDADPWVEELAESARSLRVGDPASPDIDLGPLISEAARDRFDRTIRAAVERGAAVATGGEPRPGPGLVLPADGPLRRSAEPESALAGVFGPVVLVRQVNDEEAAVAAANASRFGLAASVWGRDLDAARAVAERLDAGMVTVNDAVTPIGHASAPFGGTKASGFGRIHGVLGLREFAQTQVEQIRHAGGFRPQIFPYSQRIPTMLKVVPTTFPSVIVNLVTTAVFPHRRAGNGDRTNPSRWPDGPRIGTIQHHVGGPLRRRGPRDGNQRSLPIMAKLRLLKTGHGDLCLAEWDKDRPETITEAAAAFAEHFTPGRLAFRLDGPGQTRPIRAFDATAPEILLVPAIQGG